MVTKRQTKENRESKRERKRGREGKKEDVDDVKLSFPAQIRAIGDWQSHYRRRMSICGFICVCVYIFTALLLVFCWVFFL